MQVPPPARPQLPGDQQQAFNPAVEEPQPDYVGLSINGGIANGPTGGFIEVQCRAEGTVRASVTGQLMILQVNGFF